MRATRRNVLVVLGILVVAGGALFGTGAFTQVEAQRSVSVNTAGDANANLVLNITDSNLAGGSGGEIAFDEQELNQNATTRYDSAFVISNNEGSSLSSVTIEDPNGNPLVANSSNSVASNEVMYFEVASTSTGQYTFDVVFDTTNGDISQVDSSITVVAQS